MPKGDIVFVSDIEPALNYSGGIFAAQTLAALGDRCARGFVVQNRILVPDRDRRIATPLRIVPKPNEAYYPASGAFDRVALAQARAEQRIVAHDIPRIVGELMDYIADIERPVFWVMLEGQTLIRLAYEILRSVDAPFVAQVLDPPEWWLRAHHVDANSTGEILAKFDHVLSHADGIAATSWAMAESYHERYGTFAAAVVPPLAADLALPPARALVDDGTLTIGFAGQVYASTEFDALVAACEASNWTIAGRAVRIRAYSPSRLPVSPAIEIRPWLAQRDLITELADCDLLYVPYWFDPNFEEEARMCFPSKLTSALAAGRPVMFHGPDYASPARFLVANDTGYLCHSLDPAAVVECLRQVVDDAERYRAAAAAGSAAFHRHLTSARLAAAVDGLLGVAAPRPVRQGSAIAVRAEVMA